MRVAGDVSTFVCEKPSDQLSVHGAVPVRITERVALCPGVIVALPDTVAAGDLIVDVAEPLFEPQDTVTATDTTTDPDALAVN